MKDGGAFTTFPGSIVVDDCAFARFLKFFTIDGAASIFMIARENLASFTRFCCQVSLFSFFVNLVVFAKILSRSALHPRGSCVILHKVSGLFARFLATLGFPYLGGFHGLAAYFRSYSFPSTKIVFFLSLKEFLGIFTFWSATASLL